jgi:hypothetical protein
MKYYALELAGGSASETEIFKDKKGRIIKTTSTFSNGYFSGKALKDISKIAKSKKKIPIDEYVKIEERSLDNNIYQDTDYENCTKKDIKEIENALKNAEFDHPTEIGFEFVDCVFEVYGPLKVIVEEKEREREEDRIKEIAKDTVAKMGIGKQLKNLKSGEKISLKIDMASFLNRVNEVQPKKQLKTSNKKTKSNSESFDKKMK